IEFGQRLSANEPCVTPIIFRLPRPRLGNLFEAIMDKHLQKPKILKVETVARSRLFNVESVDLEFSNGVRRVYERMRPSDREAVM
ncbi:hypothetical protein AK51_21315, partial [Serratia nematodiphila DZ0503SBS1]